MNDSTARELLRDCLERYRRLSYGDLCQLIGSVKTEEVVGIADVTYQLEIQFFWDDAPNGNIRVLGSIDDGGWRAFAPLSDDFIKSRP